MPVVKRIASVLILLLLIFSSCNRSYTPAVAKTCIHCSQVITSEYGPRPLTVISTPTPGKDRIKIRYMGGECRYDAAIFPFIFTVVTFTEQARLFTCDSFVLCSPHFSFKLRGPPACVIYS